jgi:hypothetical protein
MCFNVFHFLLPSPLARFMVQNIRHAYIGSGGSVRSFVRSFAIEQRKNSPSNYRGY